VLREELQALLGSRQPGEVIHSCGSASPPATTAGDGARRPRRLAALPGSWSEWSADPARPSPGLGPPEPPSTRARGDAKIAPQPLGVRHVSAHPGPHRRSELTGRAVVASRPPGQGARRRSAHALRSRSPSPTAPWRRCSRPRRRSSSTPRSARPRATSAR
jgi:hypothetical protein